MKKIIIVICIMAAASLFFAGCAGVRLTPEMERITSVTDPSKCKFIRNMVITTQPHNMMRYLQYNTGKAGGDSYKVINATNQSLLVKDDVVMTSFEIYKCK